MTNSRRNFIKNITRAGIVSAGAVSLDTILNNPAHQELYAKSLEAALFSNGGKQTSKGGIQNLSPFQPAYSLLEAILANDLNDVYIMPHIVFGPSGPVNWSTGVEVKNNGNSSISGTAYHYDASGNPLLLNLGPGDPKSEMNFNVQPGGAFNYTPSSVGPDLQSGYVMISVPKGSNVAALGEYSARDSLQNLISKVPVAALKPNNVFSFSVNSSPTLSTGYAIANPNSLPLDAYVVAKDSLGNVVREGSKSLLPGEKIPEFVEKLGLGLPNNFVGGTITFFSNLPFALTALSLEQNVASSVLVSNDYKPVKTLEGTLNDIYGKPVGKQTITLTDSKYKNPITGKETPLIYSAATDENGKYIIYLLKDFGGTQTLDIKSGGFYYGYQRPVTLSDVVNNLGEIKMLPILNDGKRDALELFKAITGTDGSRPITPERPVNTTFGKHPRRPVAIKYDTFLESGPETYSGEANDMYAQILGGFDDMNFATRGQLETVANLPKSGDFGFLDENGQSISFGFKVTYPNESAGSRIRNTKYDKFGNLLYGEIIMPFVRNGGNKPQVGIREAFRHELGHVLIGVIDLALLPNAKQYDGLLMASFPKITPIESILTDWSQALRPAPAEVMGYYYVPRN